MLRLFLAGDVMTGRGIDQAMPQPCDPQLYEPYIRDARAYVHLAEQRSGPLALPLRPADIWAEGLHELRRMDPCARVVNLETSITCRGQPWPAKGIHYRMSPAHVESLQAAKVDACSLANNHVLDWGYEGLRETLDTLDGTGIASAGAGADRERALAPAAIRTWRGRVLVFGLGCTDSGIPPQWAAGERAPGVALLPDLSDSTSDEIGERIRAQRRPDDLVVASIHWGSNWGWEIPRSHRRFAHGLIDRAGVDLVHGHSSHHVKGIEVHRGRLVLYGCGDLISDYEGIGAHESFRGDLGLMYFADLDDEGRLQELQMTPTRMHGLQLRCADEHDARVLKEVLQREGAALATDAHLDAGNRLRLRF